MATGLLGLVISHQAIAGVPGKPVMSWMQANYDNGENISSTWNMWGGTNGESWQLSANNHQICSGTLVVNEKNSQQAKCTFNLEAGIQELQVTLCNNDGCTTSDIQRISIAGSPNQPPQIALSVPTRRVLPGRDPTLGAGHRRTRASTATVTHRRAPGCRAVAVRLHHGDTPGEGTVPRHPPTHAHPTNPTRLRLRRTTHNLGPAGSQGSAF